VIPINEKDQAFCTNCHIGSPQPCQATFARWYDGQFVVMPGASAWRCDVCGEISYDQDVLNRLVLLLGTESCLQDRQRGRTTGLDENWEMSLGPRRA